MAERVEKPSGGLPQSAARTEETYKTSDPRPHYLEMDGIRGIGVLIVVLVHATGRWRGMTESPLYVPLLNVEVLNVIAMGYLAVPAFFLLSGYLLTGTEEGRMRRGSYNVLNYLKRRALRIVPAYYVAIAVVFLVWPTDPSLGSVVLHLIFLQGFDPWYPADLDPGWWTQSPEILFYAVLPLLVLKFRTFSQRATIFALLLAVSLATRILMEYDVFSILLPSMGEHFGGQSRMHTYPTTPLYLFFAGVLLRMMVDRRADASHDEPDGGYRRLFAASVLTVVPLAVMAVIPHLFGLRGGQILHHPAANLGEAMLILMFASVLLGSPILKPILRWRLLVFFGTISYSLFLLNNTVLLVIKKNFEPTLRAWVPYQGEPMVWGAFLAYALVVLAVSGALAYLSYRYIESPFMRIKPK